jgi:4-amino-4-deoxychorismate lyase
MYPLFETIRIENGVILQPQWHEERMVRSCKEIWNVKMQIDLDKMIRVPEKFCFGTVRCNISYGKKTGPVTFKGYIKKPVRSLKLIVCDHIDYHFKYSDRRLLKELLSGKETCDEIVIVKNGMITDTSLSNLVFFDGIQWYTPNKPLLKGTCRERLLAEQAIRETEIHVDELNKFTGCKLINAMRYPPEEDLIPINKIGW